MDGSGTCNRVGVTYPHLQWRDGVRRVLRPARTAITLLLQHLPNLRIAVLEHAVRWKAGHAILGPEQLPVQWVTVPRGNSACTPNTCLLNMPWRNRMAASRALWPHTRRRCCDHALDVESTSDHDLVN